MKADHRHLAVDHLRITRPDGGRAVQIVHLGDWDPTGPGEPAVRDVFDIGGEPVATLRAVRSDPDDDAVFQRLENEVRAGMALHRRYGNASTPQVSRLIGYELSATEPYVLVSPRRGRPVAEIAGQLVVDRQKAFQASLFTALLLITDADLVHGGLAPATVRWDGRSVQVTEFGWAAAVGTFRPGGGSPPCASPQQRTGAHPADPTDDVWAAGLVVYHAVTGRPVAPARRAPALDIRGPALRAVLVGVFAEHPDDRPDAVTLLRRVRSNPVLPGRPADGARDLDAGRRAFDDALAAKRAAFAPPSPPTTGGAATHRWRSLSPASVALVVLSAVVCAVTLLWLVER
jgi:hypothetical protein